MTNENHLAGQVCLPYRKALFKLNQQPDLVLLC